MNGGYARYRSLWLILSRAYNGAIHKVCLEHLQCYISEFAGKHNIQDLGTLA